MSRDRRGHGYLFSARSLKGGLTFVGARRAQVSKRGSDELTDIHHSVFSGNCALPHVGVLTRATFDCARHRISHGREDFPAQSKNLGTLRISAKNQRIKTRVTISTPCHQTNNTRKLLSDQRDSAARADFLELAPRDDLEERHLALLQGRRAVTPSGGARCGARGRRLVTFAPGRHRTSCLPAL
jgi:hypothetical protein